MRNKYTENYEDKRDFEPRQTEGVEGGSDEKKKESKNSLAEIAKTLNKTLPELHKELQNMEELRGMTVEQMEETLGRKAERRGKTIAQGVAKWRHNRNNRRNRKLRNEKELQRNIPCA